MDRRSRNTYLIFGLIVCSCLSSQASGTQRPNQSGQRGQAWVDRDNAWPKRTAQAGEHSGHLSERQLGKFSGRLLGENFVISDRSVLGGDAAQRSAIAWNDSNQEYLVVWTQTNFEGTDGRTSVVLGRVLDARGLAVSEPFRISSAATIDNALGARNASVAFSRQSAEYLVVYQSDTGERERFEIFGQRVSSAGTLIGDEFLISTSLDQAYFPDVVYNPNDNDYLVVWDENQTLFAVDLEIVGRRINADSIDFGLIEPVIQVSQMSDPLTNRLALGASISFNPDRSEYMVVWQSDGAGLPEQATEIFAQRLSSEGDAIGEDDFRISQTTVTNSNRAAFDATLAYGGGSWVVVWTGDGSLLSDDQFEIFGAHVSDEGAVITEGFQLSETAVLNGTAGFPSVGYSESDDQFLITWNAFLEAQTFQIFGRGLFVDALDSTLVEPFSPVGGHLEPAVGYNNIDNELLVVWDNGEIVGQFYTTASGVDVDGPAHSFSSPARLYQNYPNPFETRTSISFEISRPGFVRLNVYDILGRHLDTLLAKHLPTGTHRFIWHPENFAAGSYVYQLVTDWGTTSRTMTRY